VPADDALLARPEQATSEWMPSAKSDGLDDAAAAASLAAATARLAPAATATTSMLRSRVTTFRLLTASVNGSRNKCKTTTT
jgi:hypothetical protein